MYYTQTDLRWCNDIMTSNLPLWRDHLGRWGCLVTCLANIMNDVNYSYDFTPEDLNNEVIKMRGYSYLADNTTPEHTASFLQWDVFKEYYKDRYLIANNLDYTSYNNCNECYFIARIRHRKYKTGHYINVIKRRDDFFTCFDVETGLLEQYHKKEITLLHKIEVIT